MTALYLLEHFGIGVSALAGVLAARGKQVDLFGVLVLALVSAFGGGTLRDLMLGDTPVAWLRDPAFPLNATLVALAAFAVTRRGQLPGRWFLAADAFALALFTMIGVQKALALKSAPVIAVAMGVITGVAGGMARDVLLGEIPLVFRREIYLYATAAFAGAVVFALVNEFAPGATWNLLVSAGVTLALRFAGIRWRLALPVYHAVEEEPVVKPDKSVSDKLP